MTKKEQNIAHSRQQAENKLTALRSNQEMLQSKKERIEQQLKANEEKIKKIEHFLRKLEDGGEQDN